MPEEFFPKESQDKEIEPILQAKEMQDEAITVMKPIMDAVIVRIYGGKIEHAQIDDWIKNHAKDFMDAYDAMKAADPDFYAKFITQPNTIVDTLYRKVTESRMENAA